ncbi:MAG: tRNA dimethylallyltransferase [Clostridia bacterium]|nr:tRNA dimethylallyltransferase [Clostridia bacterium]
MGKVIVLLGPTAVGKSALGVELAKALNGEVISADSTQIYRGLNIGTAKSTVEEMQGIAHHLIDIKNFDEGYNAFMFTEDARKKIDEIISRGKTPIIVGGTNLYVTALVKGFAFEKAGKNDVPYQNKFQLDFKLFALNIQSREKLYARINARVEVMLQNGLFEEVRALQAKGLTAEMQAGKSIGYREFLAHIAGEMTFDEAVDKIKQHSRNFAKRQLTWLRSLTDLVWLDAENPAQQNLEKIKSCLK